MNSLLVALNALIPIILVALVGYYSRKSKLISADGYKQMSKLLSKIVFPALVFTNSYTANLSSLFSSPALAYIAALLIIFFFVIIFIVQAVEPVNKRRAVMLQGSIRTSALLVGMPLAAAILPESQLGIVSIAATLTVPYNNIFPSIGFAMYSEDSKNMKDKIINLFKNPILIATLLGLALNFLSIPVPEIIMSSADYLARISTGLSILVIGGTFTYNALDEFDLSLFLTVAIKIFIGPLIALVGGYLIGLRDAELLAILIVFGGPTSVTSYPIAVDEGLDEELANNIVVYSTLASVVTMLGFITIMGHLGWIAL